MSKIKRALPEDFNPEDLQGSYDFNLNGVNRKMTPEEIEYRDNQQPIDVAIMSIRNAAHLIREHQAGAKANGSELLNAQHELNNTIEELLLKGIRTV